MLKPGADAPPFALPDQDGEVRTLEDLLADGPLVLYFYPADFTPGCTAEACSFRDAYGGVIAAGTTLAGVSPQSPGTHTRFRNRFELPFPLLSDPKKQTIKAYGVNGPFGLGVRRATFLISPKAKIVDAVRADFMISKHRAFVERVKQLCESGRAGLAKPGPTKPDPTKPEPGDA